MRRKLQREFVFRYRKTAVDPSQPERVYVAAPKPMFRTRRYEDRLIQLKAALPNAHLLEARELYSNNADWRRGWPHLSREIDALVFFISSDRWIGRGVWHEVMDARLRSLPIHLLDESGLVPFHTLAFSVFDYTDFQHFVRCRLPYRKA